METGNEITFQIEDSLHELINQIKGSASTDAVILFSQTTEIILQSELIIEGNVTINGRGSTLIADNCRHFLVQGDKSKLTLKNFILTSGNEDIGGSILVKGKSSTLILEDVRIEDSQASLGGAIYTEGVLFLLRSTITKNKAIKQGGGIWAAGNVTLQDSFILENEVTLASSESFAGGMYVDNGTVSVTSSLIDKNKVAYDIKVNEGGYAGGILVNTGTLNIQSNSSVNENVAYSSAGIQMNIGNINAYNSSISGNQSFITGNACGGGGIVIMSGNVSLFRVDLSNNKTRGMFSGGIVSFIGNVTVSQSNLSGNENRGPGGAIAANFNSCVNVSESQLTNNTAASLGGAIVNFSDSLGSVIVSNSTISGNKLTDYQTLGESLAAFVEVVSNTVNQTKSSTSNKSVHAQGDELISLAKKMIRKISQLNLAPGIIAGGGIATLLPCTVSVFKSKLQNNLVYEKVKQKDRKNSTGIGGAIFAISSNTTISRSFIRENKATDNASAIYNAGSSTIVETEIQNNIVLKEKTNYIKATVVNMVTGELSVISSALNNNSSDVDIYNDGSLSIIASEGEVQSTKPFVDLA